MLTLEKYKGSTTRHTCPACGAKKRFTRYIDTERGRYLADHVGRCDRESSCGYHFKPKDYFGDYWTNQNGIKRATTWQGRRRNNGSQAIYTQMIEQGTANRKPDFIDKRHLIASLRDFERNDFVQFLLGLFPFDPEDVLEAVSDYLIGTGRDGEAIFWQIDGKARIRTGKLIAYDRETGKRRKDQRPDWIHSALKRAGQLPETFELRQCFFGEHLIGKYPYRPIAIVEAEKTAIIASICKGVFPDLVWLACGGLSNLKPESLSRIGRGRKLILFPDANGFDKWQAIASEARKAGIAINVSNLLEKAATDAEKRDGLDLADYLIAEQRKRNDPANRERFARLAEPLLKRFDDLIDCGYTVRQAEALILNSPEYDRAIRTATA